MLRQLAVIPPIHRKQWVFVLTIIPTLLLTGCLNENGGPAVSLAHPTLIVENPLEVVVSPSPTPPPPASAPIPINPQNESASGISRLKTKLTFELTFNNTPTTLFETLDLSHATIETFDGLQILSSNFPGGAIACAESSHDNYLCIRMFEDRSYLIETFAFSDPYYDNGLFEYCPVNIDSVVCERNFMTSPDGQLAVTTRTQSAPLAVGAERIQMDGGAYMQYLKQGEIERGWEFNNNKLTPLSVATYPRLVENVSEAIESKR